MANAVYPKWKEALMSATASAALNGSGTTGVYAALIDTGVYTYNAADEFWDEGGASDAKDGLIGTAMELSSKTFTSGTFDSATNPTFSAVTGNTAEAIIIFIKNAGAETTWRLVSYQDTGVTNLPVTPNGGDITVTWDAAGIFTL